jgi:hypothetical protein
LAVKRVPEIPKGNNEKRNDKKIAKNPRINRVPDTRQGQNPQNRPTVNRGTRMNINDQTPSRRRSAKEDKRINPDSPEVKRVAKRSQGYKIKKKQKGLSRLFIAYAVLFVLVFAAVSGVISLAFYINLTATEPSEYDGLKLKMCLEHEAKDLKAVTVDTEKYVKDGNLYVNMTAIAEKFDFIMTGDRNWLRFITNEKTGESACFEVGTPFVEINGTEVRLNGNSQKYEDSLFVPVEFFYEYVNGIEISLDEEKNVLSVLRDTSRNEAGHFDEAEIDFKLKDAGPCASISEFELSEEIKAKCYFIPLINTPQA